MGAIATFTENGMPPCGPVPVDLSPPLHRCSVNVTQFEPDLASGLDSADVLWTQGRSESFLHCSWSAR